MNKTKHTILIKNIPNIELVSLTGHTWYDYNHNLVSWSGTTYIGPEIDDIIFNVSGGTVSSGYYKWSGTIWNEITESEAHDDFIIPIFLENRMDEQGVIVGFEGEMTQIEQYCNFAYSGSTGSTIIKIYNTVYNEVLRTLNDQLFKIDFGDGNVETIGAATFSSLTHTYLTGGTYTVSIYLYSDWGTQKTSKEITVPLLDTTNVENVFGEFTGVTLPDTGTTEYQKYINHLDFTTTGTTYPLDYSGFTYVAFGGSKLDQKKLYGTNNYSDDVEITTGYTGYTIDLFYYRDYPDGYTMITGTTNGTEITKEEVPNFCITRNEHFLGFVEEPTIYSDVFVDRGKQGVMEKNLRLSEIDNIGELVIYGNGYFNIIKQ